MAKRPPRPLREPPGPPARYSPWELPPYRHVPGLTPHPVKDPKGHLYGHEAPEPRDSCRSLTTRWRECPEYLYGVDLFNRSFLWESHEAWESVWIAAGKKSESARFVQGLIQVAAALLRQHLGTPVGAQNLLFRAWERWSAAENSLLEFDEKAYLGVPVLTWKGAVEDYTIGGGTSYPFLVLEVDHLPGSMVR